MARKRRIERGGAGRREAGCRSSRARSATRQEPVQPVCTAGRHISASERSISAGAPGSRARPPAPGVQRRVRRQQLVCRLGHHALAPSAGRAFHEHVRCARRRSMAAARPASAARRTSRRRSAATRIPACQDPGHSARAAARARSRESARRRRGARVASPFQRASRCVPSSAARDGGQLRSAISGARAHSRLRRARGDGGRRRLPRPPQRVLSGEARRRAGGRMAIQRRSSRGSVAARVGRASRVPAAVQRGLQPRHTAATPAESESAWLPPLGPSASASSAA